MLHALGKTAHDARKDAETRAARALLRLVVEQLHADADREERNGAVTASRATADRPGAIEAHPCTGANAPTPGSTTPAA